MMSDKPMRLFMNLDSVDVRCPCGASVSGEGEPIERFIKDHKAHTNGFCEETVTADGARAYQPPGPRTRTTKL